MGPNKDAFHNEQVLEKPDLTGVIVKGTNLKAPRLAFKRQRTGKEAKRGVEEN
jgi:hypothetical protein